MNELLMILMFPFAALAISALTDDNDTHPEPSVDPEPEPEDQQLGNTDAVDGIVQGGGGNDTLSLTHDGTTYVAVSEYDERPDNEYAFFGGADNTYEPGREPGPDWMIVGRGGAGDDTITGTGNGLDLYGGTGNDRIEGQGNNTGLNGGDGNDTIIADGTRFIIHGGAGDDNITASGSNHWINGGEGADTIDVSNLRDSMIHLDGQDQLVGRGNDTDGLRFGITGGSFTGNDAGDDIIAFDGASVDGGKGDDLLRNSDATNNPENGLIGSTTLSGGEGNDTLIGNYAASNYLPTAQDRHEWHIGTSDDVLDGGAGNDAISFDRADTVTGGEGADRLEGFLDEDHTAVITDFDPAEDSLRVNLDPFKAGEGFANVAVSENDGATLLHLNGELILRIDGATGLRVGFEHGESFAGSSNLPQTYTDLAGNPVTADALDVVINAWEGLET